MYLSNQSLLVILIVGIVAGWLAGRVMEGGGFGLIGDLIVGLIGAFIGDWLLPRLGVHLGTGIVALIVNAFIGAIVLLLTLRLIGGNRHRWGRRWKPRARVPLRAHQINAPASFFTVSQCTALQGSARPFSPSADVWQPGDRR